MNRRDFFRRAAVAVISVAAAVYAPGIAKAWEPVGPGLDVELVNGLIRDTLRRMAPGSFARIAAGLADYS